ncbi:zinc finger protein 37 isoform X4 [Amyelois transitella]|uniref:zinc finger protein 37 isoform X4 n=1 Tax=Amyelois transitella TaxID=680683 RepID=UPI00067E5168|nr:zinc finger protein 37 isoform X4 [Amyelois transitella]
MPQTSICRLCLCTDVRMFTIAGTPLQAVYEKITDSELLDNMKPVAACYICHAHLRRCRSFMEKSVRADEVLTGFLMNNKLTVKTVARIDRKSHNLVHSLSIKKMSSEDHLEVEESKVKTEVEFEFAGAEDVNDMSYEDHSDFPAFNDTEVQLDEKAFVLRPENEYLENVEYLKEEKQLIASDADENRNADSDDERPLNTLKSNLKCRSDDSDRTTTKRTVASVKKTLKKATVKKSQQKEKKRIKLIKRPTPADQEKVQEIRNIIFKRRRSCRVCQMKFATEVELQHHRIEHRPYACQICQKRFRTNPLLKQHFIIHSGEKRYQCYECGTQFSRPHHLRNHLRTHSGEVPYECNVCNRRFNNSSNLRQHIKRHTGEKPYQCDVCQRKFAQKNTLQKHLKTHGPGRCNDLQRTREKPYKCVECGAGFVRIYHLKRHLTIHSGEKPFECSVCCRKFNRKSTLTTHLRTHTVEPKPYSFNL